MRAAALGPVGLRDHPFCNHTKGWLKNYRFCPFLGKQKVTGATNREIYGGEYPIIHVLFTVFK